MKVAFISSEVFPFEKTGGLADVCGALPLALEKLGFEVAIFMPLYKSICDSDLERTQMNKSLSMTKIGENITVYFIEHEEYFCRDGIYGDASGDYKDNLERFKYFCSKILEHVKQINLKIDVFHCHDWHAALIPVYLKNKLQNDDFFKNSRSLFTIHNLAYQGVFPKESFKVLGLEAALYGSFFEFYNQINLLKAGILSCDGLSTVSPTYADEIQTDRYGCGLESVIEKRKKDLIGVLNGVDTHVWDPQEDVFIAEKYSAENLCGKAKNKEKLQWACNLPVKKETPLFGFVGRLCHQKGLDLICESMDEILDEQDIQMVFLGVGDEKYQDILKKIAKKYPQQVSVTIGFDEKKAHQIYAGSDIFLIPSIFEPCGLSQMISLRYGTIPLVYHTGGLADTVKPYDKDGNGFVFYVYENNAFLATVQEAVGVYHDKEVFKDLVKKAFSYEFVWEDSAKKYQQIYEDLMAQ